VDVSWKVAFPVEHFSEKHFVSVKQEFMSALFVEFV